MRERLSAAPTRANRNHEMLDSADAVLQTFCLLDTSLPIHATQRPVRIERRDSRKGD